MNDNTIIMAIDPGLTGAVAFYAPINADHVGVYDMPVAGGAVNVHELRKLIETYHPNTCVIERVGPMPRDGVMQAWRFSGAYHAALATVMLSHIATTLVTPAVWKKAMHVRGGPAGKEQCRKLAIQMFPYSAAMFARKKDAGRAEAALLAVYFSQVRDRNFAMFKKEE